MVGNEKVLLEEYSVHTINVLGAVVSKIEYKQRITKRLILYIVLFSSLVTLLLTINQLYMEYVAEMDQVKGQMNQIKTISLHSLTENLWNLWEKQIKIQLNDLIQLSDIMYLEIRSKGQVVASAGNRTSKNIISQTLPMIYTRDDKKILIGELLIIATLEGIYQELLDKTLIILISNAVKTFLVSIFMFFIFQHFVIKHLIKISQHLQRITPDNLDTILTLKRRTHKDELQQVVTTINKMGVNLSKTTVSKEYADNIIMSMADSLIVINPNTIIRTVNKATLDLLRYKEQELLGKPIGIIFEEKQEIFRETEIPKLIKKSCTMGIETTYLTKKKKKVPIIFSSSIIQDNDNKIIGIVCVARDITERKLAEEALRSSLKEKEVLLREIHHRVKNNMQVITSLLRLQSAKIMEKQYADMLKDSQARIKSMAFVHEKLYQSKDFAEVDFNEYVKTLVKSLFRFYGANPEKIALWIEVDDVSLELDSAIPCGLIINELISNALKHAFPENREGEVRVTLGSATEDEFKLTVSDNGAGMPEHIDFRNTESLGLHLVTILAEEQLHGKVELNRIEGTKYCIKFKKAREKARI